MPISRIKEILENIGGQNYFSTLNMSKVLCMKIFDTLPLSHPPGTLRVA